MLAPVAVKLFSERATKSLQYNKVKAIVINQFTGLMELAMQGLPAMEAICLMLEDAEDLLPKRTSACMERPYINRQHVVGHTG